MKLYKTLDVVEKNNNTMIFAWLFFHVILINFFLGVIIMKQTSYFLDAVKQGCRISCHLPIKVITSLGTFSFSTHVHFYKYEEDLNKNKKKN